MQTKTFLFYIGQEFFPIHKVIKPYFAEVTYDYDTERKTVTVTKIALHPSCIENCSLGQRFVEEVELAADNNADSEFNKGYFVNDTFSDERMELDREQSKGLGRIG